ncbi:MAG: hypothetical protein ACK4TA_18890 [Saprospiraceae bacterium]
MESVQIFSLEKQISDLKMIQKGGIIKELKIIPSFRNKSVKLFEFKLLPAIIKTSLGNIDYDFSKYKIRIKYNNNSIPITHIIAPYIVPNAPHRYRNKSLCLYKQSNFQWTNNNSLAKDIVPLIMMWIYFYEDWLVSNVWKGDEAEH